MKDTELNFKNPNIHLIRKEMKTKRTMPTDYDQIIKLNQLKNLAHKIAEATIKYHGFYTCMMIQEDGSELKTVVIK